MGAPPGPAHGSAGPAGEPVTRWPFAFELLAVLALLAAAGALLHVPKQRVPMVFDMVGYAAQAHGLLTGHGNTIAMGDEHLPGIYPVGVPALAAAAMALLGPDLRNGLWAVLACALGTLLCAHLCVRGAGLPPWAGLLAIVLVPCSPLFRSTSGYIMSQVPTAFAVSLVLWLFLARRSGTALFLAGLIASLSLLLRYANVSFPAAVLGAELLCGTSRELPRRRALVLLCAGLGLGTALLLAHNALLYGGPFTTGYRLWGWDVGGQFSWHNLLDAPGTARFKGDHILLSAAFGLSELTSVPLVLAAAAGLVFCWRDGRPRADRPARPEARLLGGLSACTLGATWLLLAGYSFRSETYLVPTVPVIAVLAAYGTARLLQLALRRAPARAWRAGAPVLALLLAATLCGVSTARAPGPSEDVTASVERFRNLERAGVVLPADAALVTTADPGIVEPLFRTQPARTVLYLGPYASPLLEQRTLAQLGTRTVKPEHVVRWAAGRLAAGHPVYLDQNPPPRGLFASHVAIRTALRSAFQLVPCDATNIVQLVRHAAAPPR